MGLVAWWHVCFKHKLQIGGSTPGSTPASHLKWKGSGAVHLIRKKRKKITHA
jgi:N-methylhydantoinase B/oxoprolinase/acetone carboxylase alpha subunit